MRRRVPTYPRDAVLTKQEVAKALACTVRTIERMDLPTIYLTGKRSPRYLWGTVLDYIAQRAA